MRRKLFSLATTGLAALSLFVFCTAICGLIRTQFVHDSLSYDAPPGPPFGPGSRVSYDLGWHSGSIAFQRGVAGLMHPGTPGITQPDPPPRWGYRHYKPTFADTAERLRAIRGTGPRWTYERDGSQQGAILEETYVVVPCWLVAAASAPLSAAWAIRRRRVRRRHRKGHCPTCGYDCRATPERCPECGTPAPPPSTLPIGGA